MLSADVTPEVKREALEAGFDAFLPKPLEALRLLEEVQALSALKPEEARRAEGQSRARRAMAPPAAAAVVNTETLGHLEELSSSQAFVEKLVGVFLTDSAALLERIEQALNAPQPAGVPFAAARHEGLFGEHGYRPPDWALRRSWPACPIPSFACRPPACCIRSAKSLARARGELERYLRERKRSAG